jgi:diguanylate cyclase (GGDEF)-like protein
VGAVSIDQGSLLIAAGIGGAALALTLLSGWLHNRGDRFLVSWMIGISMLSVGVVLYAVGSPGSMARVATSFALQSAGFCAIYVGARQFVGAATSRGLLAALALAVMIVTAPILAGFDGAGMALYNLLAAALLAATAARYWAVRSEAPATVAALTLLYALTSLSFVACAAVLLRDADWTLGQRPDNWAEQFNAIMCIVGITGVGALSLSLTHARSARRHRDEARTDALTGLLNRRALFDAMAAEAFGPGHAVVIFDLDRFKSVNDRYGHAAGDEVLRAFAQTMRLNLRDGDIAARTGGEEFVLVMREASLQLATGTAERIRVTFSSRQVETPSGPLAATASAGVALGGARTESFEAVLNRADMSLYRAKDGGRNRVAADLHVAA